ncbi:hypothetical protein AMTRI_Chr01g108100 [Amborella trichopoda]|uniref:Uncharacterized protein n=1 Tax=Amborella trichopoda TaxID=13333 RepID=W1NST8_AMBTC|nr:jasmonic acid-amido synthetase JAR1 [Amborella trichopoda]XP_011620631.1 jasmonic acid-amido synthetase JAR1 [Amborella trichopoda]XP_020518377.1 jasmonic acid-amido synthetase JAR1 [Amborella trichopoda]XP_020518378.1 jasmonic acid-amido synthetase JAR1 [Amborella trichopoda]ERM98778.1 hypothetical protein AMTR_s00093p00015400 [Amborella trichopoda]|eukprot:XP_006833500.1 jasmonic acid-amido synthetase JAR1 [Amborella trichopoda]
MPAQMAEFDCESVIEAFEVATKDAERVQRETLRRILEENGETEYLQEWGLRGRTDPESFKACIPLATHQDLEQYIHRIVDGDTRPILTGKTVTTISLSSGTTQGKPKFVPFNEELLENTMQVFQTAFAFRNREFPVTNGKALQFIYSSKQFKTKGGLAAGTATTNVFRSERFKKTMNAIQSQCCSPDEVIFGPDFQQALYCHLLCGLVFSNEIQYVASTFAHSLVHAFRTFEQLWEELCMDIREGEISNRITVPSIRTAVSKLLKADPQLANSIYDKCSKLKSNDWYGLIPELWPNAKYLYGIMTGAMEPYLKKLRHYAGSLPLVSSDFGSSEGWIGVNVDSRLPPEKVTFTVLPDIGYFEFIPLKKEEVEDQVFEQNAANAHYLEIEPIGLTEVKVGEEYEIILTNFAGLYRYRLGDIVKVMGFHNRSPKLQFVCRRSLLLTINLDKNTEKDLQLAVEEATRLLTPYRVELVDFTSFVDMSSDPGHYVIFWELNAVEVGATLLESCCSSMDRAFVDAGYVSSRKAGLIGALELRVLKRGTFQKILDHYLSMGAAVSQFKMPRCVGSSHQAVLQILNNNVVENYLSTAF